jgi:hypothetical protein
MFNCNFTVVLVAPSECELLLCSSWPTTHRGLRPCGSTLARMFTTSPRTSTWRSRAPSLLSHSLIHYPSVRPLSVSFLAAEQSIAAARSSTAPLLTPSQALPSLPPRAPLRRALLAIPCAAATLVAPPPATRVAGATTTEGRYLRGRLASGRCGARQGRPRVSGCFPATSPTPTWPPFAANDELRRSPSVESRQGCRAGI